MFKSKIQQNESSQMDAQKEKVVVLYCFTLRLQNTTEREGFRLRPPSGLDEITQKKMRKFPLECLLTLFCKIFFCHSGVSVDTRVIQKRLHLSAVCFVVSPQIPLCSSSANSNVPGGLAEANCQAFFGGFFSPDTLWVNTSFGTADECRWKYVLQNVIETAENAICVNRRFDFDTFFNANTRAVRRCFAGWF